MSLNLNLLFYVLAAMACLMAIATVLTRHILRSAIYLMAVLCISAGFYLLLGAEFLAGAQVLVYVGGIVILLIFAVMLTRSADLEHDCPSIMRKILGFIGSASFFATSFYLLKQSPLALSREVSSSSGGIREIGLAFLDTGATGYILPFEVISLLLLAVLIAGIVLARQLPSQEKI